MIIQNNTVYTAADGDIASGAYVARTVDSNGKTTSYTYDKIKSLLKSVKNANGQTTTYKYYTESDRLASVESDSTKVTYTYDDSKLSKVSVAKGSKNENYSFVYDKFGNVNSTKVGSTELTNTYRNGCYKLWSRNSDRKNY